MRFALLALCAVIVWPAASATTYLVRPDGIGPFPTIQAAINAAVNGDVIELADGVFRGNGNRDVDYLGKEIVIRSQGGDPYACVLDCEGSPETPHRGFVFRNVGSNGVLAGVTVMNGFQYEGGGVYLEDSSPRIERCIFEHN